MNDPVKRNSIQPKQINGQTTLQGAWATGAANRAAEGLPPLPSSSSLLSSPMAPRAPRPPVVLRVKNPVGRPRTRPADLPDLPPKVRGRPANHAAAPPSEPADGCEADTDAAAPSVPAPESSTTAAPEAAAPEAAAAKPTTGRYKKFSHLEKQFAAQALQKHHMNLQATVNFLVDNFSGTFKGLVRQTLGGPTWKLGYVPVAKPGRKRLLEAAVLLAISVAIMRLITSGVSTYALVIRPLVRQAIIDGGQAALLEENGGPFGISTSWINKLCCGMNLVMRRGTTAAQKVPENYVELITRHNQRIAVAVANYGILPPMVLNFDQTGIKFCPISGASRAVKGSNTISLLAMTDNRQVTGVFAAAADGTLLPPQLIMGGTTRQVLPFTYFEDGPPKLGKKGQVLKPGKTNAGPLLPGRVEKFGDWSWAYTDNHWSSLETMQQYVEEVLHPYFTRIKLEHGRPAEQKCIILMDCWSVHRSKLFRAHLKAVYPYIIFFFVPGGCTGIAQVMDLCVNRTVKSTMRKCFAQYLSDLVSDHAAKLLLNPALGHFSFDSGLLAMKPHLPEWVWAGLQQCTVASILAGWEKSGAMQAWDKDYQNQALLAIVNGQLVLDIFAATDSPDGAVEPEDCDASDVLAYDSGAESDSNADGRVRLYDLAQVECKVVFGRRVAKRAKRAVDADSVGGAADGVGDVTKASSGLAAGSTVVALGDGAKVGSTAAVASNAANVSHGKGKKRSALLAAITCNDDSEQQDVQEPHTEPASILPTTTEAAAHIISSDTGIKQVPRIPPIKLNHRFKPRALPDTAALVSLAPPSVDNGTAAAAAAAAATDLSEPLQAAAPLEVSSIALLPQNTQNAVVAAASNLVKTSGTAAPGNVTSIIPPTQMTITAAVTAALAAAQAQVKQKGKTYSLSQSTLKTYRQAPLSFGIRTAAPSSQLFGSTTAAASQQFDTVGTASSQLGDSTQVWSQQACITAQAPASQNRGGSAVVAALQAGNMAASQDRGGKAAAAAPQVGTAAAASLGRSGKTAAAAAPSAAALQVGVKAAAAALDRGGKTATATAAALQGGSTAAAAVAAASLGRGGTTSAAAPSAAAAAALDRVGKTARATAAALQGGSTAAAAASAAASQGKGGKTSAAAPSATGAAALQVGVKSAALSLDMGGGMVVAAAALGRGSKSAAAQRGISQAATAPQVAITQPNPPPPTIKQNTIPATGTEAHFPWIPVDDEIPTSQWGEYLSRCDWARDGTLDVPAHYKPAFGQGMPGFVHRHRVVEGWLECGDVRRSLQILYDRFERERSFPTTDMQQLPKTLVVDQHFAERLFRGHNGPQGRGDLPDSPAGQYSFKHGWRHLCNSNSTYPTERQTKITEAEVLGCDNIILPFLDTGHFILVHVRVKERCVRQLNSKLTSRMPDRDALLLHVASFMKDLQAAAGHPVGQWVVEAQPANLPQQLDDDSCGMFVIGFAAQIFAQHYDCDQLEQRHIPSMRVNLLEIIAKEIPGPDYKH